MQIFKTHDSTAGWVTVGTLPKQMISTSLEVISYSMEKMHNGRLSQMLLKDVIDGEETISCLETLDVASQIFWFVII